MTPKHLLINLIILLFLPLAWLSHIITYPYYKLTEKKREKENRRDREKFEDEFGDGYKKRTMLWGWFNEPKKTMADLKSVKVMKKFDKLASREIHPEAFGKLTRTERRAITPSGFAKAFFKANK